MHLKVHRKNDRLSVDPSLSGNWAQVNRKSFYRSREREKERERSGSVADLFENVYCAPKTQLYDPITRGVANL